MKSKDTLYSLQVPFFYKFLCSRADFLSRLKEKTHLSAKGFLSLSQQTGCSQQAGRMSIMSAGVHHAGPSGTILCFVSLFDRQRIRIRPESNRAASLSRAL